MTLVNMRRRVWWRRSRSRSGPSSQGEGRAKSARTGRLRRGIALLGVTAVVASSAAGMLPASAAEEDHAEAEGQLVNTGSLAPIAALSGAYSAFGDGGPNSTN